MEADLSVAHRLPILYREALDAVGALEQSGDRLVAARLRREILEAYALRWDEDACHRLETLAGRARDLGEPARQGRSGFILRPAWLGKR